MSTQQPTPMAAKNSLQSPLNPTAGVSSNMTPKVSMRIGVPPLYNSKQSEIFGDNTTKAV